MNLFVFASLFVFVFCSFPYGCFWENSGHDSEGSHVSTLKILLQIAIILQVYGPTILHFFVEGSYGNHSPISGGGLYRDSLSW